MLISRSRHFKPSTQRLAEVACRHCASDGSLQRLFRNKVGLAHPNPSPILHPDRVLVSPRWEGNSPWTSFSLRARPLLASRGVLHTRTVAFLLTRSEARNHHRVLRPRRHLLPRRARVSHACEFGPRRRDMGFVADAIAGPSRPLGMTAPTRVFWLGLPSSATRAR